MLDVYLPLILGDKQWIMRVEWIQEWIPFDICSAWLIGVGNDFGIHVCSWHRWLCQYSYPIRMQWLKYDKKVYILVTSQCRIILSATSITLHMSIFYYHVASMNMANLHFAPISGSPMQVNMSSSVTVDIAKVIDSSNILPWAENIAKSLSFLWDKDRNL